MNRVAEYLRISDDYEGNRYSLSWAPGGDAVERPDGSTFAFAAEVALFLEGYTSVGPLIHFAYVLYLLQRFDTRLLEPEEPGLPTTGPGRELVEKSDSLASAFCEAGRPLRNAGALCAWLCREVPPVVEAPPASEVCLRLASPALAASLSTYRAATDPLAGEVDVPPLSALDFEMRFLNGLRRLDPLEVACWLRHGRGPLPDPGPRVAEAVAALKPRSLEGVLATLVGRDRLSVAVPMVGQLVGALSLPPRRLAHQALPTGGYADVSSRGRPEQILPSQFAVDEMEFLRRFAENELLYFHKEEPHAPLTEELVLLLDQGVRTWGVVRHALNASALAFGRLAARRKLTLRLAATASPGRLFDLLELDDEALGRLWEACDLSPDPALALEKLLEAPAERRRDLVVLTHPRSVLGPDFAAATLRASAGTRVFTVAVDEPGRVSFREWRHGVPVKLADFRINFALAPALSKGSRPDDPRGWRGDVEPVPFPFRFGVTHRIDRPLFDFDHAGRRLLLCTHRGLLHAWDVDGSAAEVLPRAFVEGEVLEQVDAVLGVADGFVVAGRVGKALVAMHYDFGSRKARAYALGPSFDGEWTWSYARDVHTVVARGKTYSRAVDLANGTIDRSRESKERPSSRAIRAFEAAGNHAVPPPGLAIVDEGRPEPERGGFVRLDRQTGEVRVERVVPPWEPFTPVADGRPSLQGNWLEFAQCRGRVLALGHSGPGRPAEVQLFHGPGGVPSLGLGRLDGPPSLILSVDGRLVARRVNDRQIEVRPTTHQDRLVFETTKGGSHSDARVTLGRHGMQVHVGKHVSLIRWDRDKLTVSTVAEGSTRSDHDIITWPLDRPAFSGTPLPAPLLGQSSRFVACARAELTAVVDIFGQVALFDRADRLVAMFFAFRGQVAAWIPDGARLGPWQGPNRLIDGPPTPDAAERIGRALKLATEASLARPR